MLLTTETSLQPYILPLSCTPASPSYLAERMEPRPLGFRSILEKGQALPLPQLH